MNKVFYHDPARMDMEQFNFRDGRYLLGFVGGRDNDGYARQGVKDTATGEVFDSGPNEWLNTLYNRRSLRQTPWAVVPMEFVCMSDLPADKTPDDIFVLYVCGPVAWGDGVIVVESSGTVLYADRNAARLTGLDGTGRLFGGVPSEYVSINVMRVLDRESALNIVATMTTFYYVESQYGTAGPSASFGFSTVVESETPLETYHEQTRSLSGPYTQDAAERRAAADNAEFDAYAATH